MDQFWKSFDTGDDIMYVTDIDTHDLVYASDSVLQFDTDGTALTKKCYEALQGFAAPCAMCTNDRIASGECYEWDYFNQIVCKPYHLVDRLIEREGRRYRLEVGVDISNAEDYGQRFRGLEPNTILVNESLRMALDEPDPDRSILRVLEYVGQALGSERAYIFEFADEQHIANTYEWCAYGIDPKKGAFGYVPKDACAVWLDKFERGEVVVVPEVEKIQMSDLALYEYLSAHNISSTVASSLFSDGHVNGFYGFDNPPAHRLDDTYQLLKTIGHFLDSLILRRDLLRRLEELSFVDQMTRLGNRHAMKRDFEQFDKDESVGIAYCDVCGLKKMNDTRGHAAGDEMLMRACACLREACEDGGLLYRIGGDELLVMMNGVSEQEFHARCDKLRKSSLEAEAPLAVGGVWHERIHLELDDLLELTDELMYNDKRAYYEALRQ